MKKNLKILIFIIICTNIIANEIDEIYDGNMDKKEVQSIVNDYENSDEYKENDNINKLQNETLQTKDKDIKDIPIHSEKINKEDNNVNFNEIKDIPIKNETKTEKEMPKTINDYEKSHDEVIETYINDHKEAISAAEYIEIGDAFNEQENYDDALESYKEAYKVDSENIVAIKKIANIYKEEKNYEDAISFFEKAILQNPEDKMLYYGTAQLYEEIKKYKKANEYYEEYLDLDEYSDSKLIFYLGNAYFINKHYEKAKNIFTKDKSDYYKNIFGAALTSRFLGYYKDAIKDYKRLIGIRADLYEAYLGLAISYQLSGDFNDAITYFKECIEKKKDKSLYITVSRLYLIQHNKIDAKDIISKGLKLFPYSKELRDMMLEVYN